MLKIFKKSCEFKKMICDDEINEINHFCVNNKHKTLLWHKAALEFPLYK